MPALTTIAASSIACGPCPLPPSLAGVGVLALVLIATMLSVTFATNAAMAANRPVIEVLHLIGAKDAFIAGHFQRHFLKLGLKGGAIGGGAALALFALVH